MNNEETILDPQSFADSNTSKSGVPTCNEPEKQVSTCKESKPAKGSNTAEKAAYAAGGFVAGAASMFAGEAMASVKTGDEIDNVVGEQPQIDPANSPSEQESIISSDEGLRVAHVDDDKSFAEAFADARAQVGPGGVFEWHGKVYGTFYKDEWDQMSAEERAEWQSKVDYNDLRDENEAQQYTPHHSAPQHTVPQTQEPAQNTNVHQASQPQINIADIRQVDVDGNGQMDTVVELDNGVMFADLDHDSVADVAALDANGDGVIENDEVVDVRAEHIVLPHTSNGTTYASQQSGGAADVDVHVLHVGQADLNGDGLAENVAVVEVEGNEVLLVDIDQEGTADVLIRNENGIPHAYDITGEDIDMPTMSDGDMYMAEADSEPDYTNDADIDLYDA